MYETGTETCPVAAMELYMSKLCKCSDAFFQRPRDIFKASDSTWYTKQPVGVNTLRNVVKTLCEDTGIPGYYTNHSLRSSSVTRMYQSGVDEQLIQEITGHRSLAVQSYKQTSQSQRQRASQIISGDIRN